MKIVIPDDYQNLVDRLDCYKLIQHHGITRYREPARDLDQLVARLAETDIVVSIRERVEFSRALLEALLRRYSRVRPPVAMIVALADRIAGSPEPRWSATPPPTLPSARSRSTTQRSWAL